MKINLVCARISVQCEYVFVQGVSAIVPDENGALKFSPYKKIHYL